MSVKCTQVVFPPLVPMNFNLISFKGDNSVIAYIMKLKSFGSMVLNKDQISFLKFSRNRTNIVLFSYVQFLNSVPQPHKYFKCLH